MNTNSNTYTVVYTTIIVIIVAAILAFAAMSLNGRQVANMKAETIGQILKAAKIESGESNAEIINAYKSQIAEAYTVDLTGAKKGELPAEDATIFTTSQLKAQNYKIAGGESDATLPVYVFKNGTKVVPIYGAGLWGPVWGYVAVGTDGKIVGATFDHASETPGLGGKIKDDPAFSAQFDGKAFDFNDVVPFDIVKGGAPAGKVNAIDAITGATMTSKGLGEAVNAWARAYAPVLAAAPCCCEETQAEETTKTEE
ncbi:MAG: NADH:ubiquinone reductase (Na(+)-transporting) subunit C [Bacteroidales bacterium]|nr:NADH:ubiquinone reductase (Na(+)-transporting) subunit C [Candidatus Cryptobacteroides onthequi]MCQ2165688.1 NADH:ubiquinone reductase (Na(+)-transporting) subunit C [Bacteroidales bacterium]